MSQAIIIEVPQSTPAIQRFEDLAAPRVFVERAAAPSLSEAQRDAHAELASWRSPFDHLLCPTDGRSLYGAFDPQLRFRGKATKMKGGAGTEIDSEFDKPIIVPPRPDKMFDPGSILHFDLDRELRVGVWENFPRGLYSLTLDRAEMEFRVARRFAEYGLGLDGQQYGQLFVESGGLRKPERDYRGRETGVAFVEFDPELDFLVDHLVFTWVEDRENRKVSFVSLPNKGIYSEPQSVSDPMQLIENYFTFSNRVFKLKATSAVEAGIANHGSEPNNFWYHPDDDLIYFADAGPCTFYDEAYLPRELWGPTLLQNLAVDLKLYVESLSLFAHSYQYRDLLRNETIQPFHQFLSSFFEGLADPQDVESTASLLHSNYLSFQTALWQKRLDPIAMHYQRNTLIKQTAKNPPWMRDWSVVHDITLPTLISRCAVLMKQSTLADHGFVLPDFSYETLYKTVESGIHEYVRLGQAMGGSEGENE